MAPIAAPHDAASAPLADYFYIAGIESSRIFPGRSNRHSGSNALSKSPPLDPTSEEDQPEPTDLNGQRPASPASHSTTSPTASKRASARFSWDTRKSIGSVIGLEGRVTESNRSSRTIRIAPPSDDANALPNTREQDFDEALRRFAADRDSILDEIQFSAGQIAQPDRPAPRPRPKAQRIVSSEQLEKGSIRRRLSTMNPLSRSNTTLKRCMHSEAAL